MLPKHVWRIYAEFDCSWLQVVEAGILNLISFGFGVLMCFNWVQTRVGVYQAVEKLTATAERVVGRVTTTDYELKLHPVLTTSGELAIVPSVLPTFKRERIDLTLQIRILCWNSFA